MSYDENDLDEFENSAHFDYLTPLTIGPLTVTSTREYQSMLVLIHEQYTSAGLDEEEIEFYDDDFGVDSDRDNAEGTRVMMESDVNKDIILDIGDIATGFQELSTMDQAIDLDIEQMAGQMSQLATEFSFDSVFPDKLTDKLKISAYKPECPTEVEMQQGLYPPRPPAIYKKNNPPVAIILSSHTTRSSFRIRTDLRWSAILNDHLPPGVSLGKEEHYDETIGRRLSDAVTDYNSTSTLESMASYASTQARSNSRPSGGIVYMLMADGEKRNVGTHSYRLRSDVEYAIDVDVADLALCEFFAAQAGEGMACATGSHSLHQMINAIMSAALEKGNPDCHVQCEHHNDDITIMSMDQEQILCSIDITSTAGIWHKPLRQRRMVAVSKYDIAAILIMSLQGNPARALAAGVACSLAVEHPSYYGHPDYSKLPEDLKYQYRISNKLSSLSQRTVKKLSLMCYQAAIAECVEDAIGMDTHDDGRPYREKAQILIDTIRNLKTKEKYAFPPLPTGEIRGLWDKHTEVRFLDQILTIPNAAFLHDLDGSSIKPEDQSNFLKRFPADGRYPYMDVRDACDYLQDHVMPAHGEVHLGPCKDIDPDTPDAYIWDRVSKLYGASAVAQFAEVRADVVRAVDHSPTNNPSIWRAKIVYKGKVIAFYRSRDNVSDARGYRIDWFALSAYPVLGGLDVSSDASRPIYLWPRQRLRSQEMDLAGMAPRRLKLTLFSMMSMARVCRATPEEVVLAWQKLALTSVCATWASGANFITCRHLSASLASPSPPFDAMSKKFKPPMTAACILYFASLTRCLEGWFKRDQYHDRAAILGLPRAYSQLESYWLVWVPDEFADTNKHFTDCVLALHGEYQDSSESSREREKDLLSQYEILLRPTVHINDIRESMRASCTIETGGKFGWSVFGSMASAYALTTQGCPDRFDRTFSKGGKARNLASHMTVRHSGRINPHGRLEQGTVAEMIIKQGTDAYLSTLSAGLRFYYGDTPYFMNHPKKGEHKDREISITDPDSRIMLNDAEHICGEYGRHTKIDMLKRPDKDAFFYRISSEAFLKGGVVKASDASRFAAMMSNVAVSITCYTLGAIGGSAHLQASASIYKRLASRRMVIDTMVLDEIDKRLDQERSSTELAKLRKAKTWIRRMPKVGEHDGNALRSYTTASHTGQGMSHVGMSIEHGGALLISLAAAEQAEILIRGKRIHVTGVPLVTSDDSTIVATVDDDNTNAVLSRAERQRACHMFMRVQDRTRQVALRLVSVMPNLSKEKTSGIAGEFNSQDNGIGVACPVLGYREMVCQLVRPSAQSLIADYLDAYAYGRTVALSGLGVSSGIYAHHLALDALEQRWKLTEPEKAMLDRLDFLPEAVLKGASSREILRTPASMLPARTRSALIQLAMDYHSESDEVDIHTKDMAFTVLGHVRVSMKQQHRKALKAIETLAMVHESEGRVHQADMLRQTLSATISSARTRGAGRIAQRVRGRTVTPGTVLGCSFQKAPMVEATMMWYDHLTSIIKKVVPNEEVKALASVYGGYVTCTKFSMIRYPQPATRRRSRAIGVKKPKYILEGYGHTPFGRHVVERSQARVIPSYSQVERREVSIYYAMCAYHSIPEHVQYGDKLVYSWSRGESCILAHVAPSLELAPRIETEEFWGGMAEDDIAFLRDTEHMNPGVPVLALNYASGGRAHFHGVHHGMGFSASIDFDPHTAPQFVRLPGMARGGASVVLALQSWSTERKWYGTGPTSDEITAYQHDGRRQHVNDDVESAWMSLERQSYTRVPIAAAVVDYGETSEMFMIDPKLSNQCAEPLLPYHKAKFLLNVATGGYWYSATRGVCVRAYLKGHAGVENCWTGPVLGWRMSRSAEPVYGWSAPEHGSVRSLTVVGGVDTDDQISVLNPHDYASTHCYVDRTGMHMVSEVHVLKATHTNWGMILKLNDGNLLFNADQGRAHLIDCELPASRVQQSRLDKEQVKSELWDLVHGRETDMDDFF